MNNTNLTLDSIDAKTNKSVPLPSLIWKGIDYNTALPSPEEVAAFLTGGGGAPIRLQDEFAFFAGVERLPKLKEAYFKSDRSALDQDSNSKRPESS